MKEGRVHPFPGKPVVGDRFLSVSYISISCIYLVIYWIEDCLEFNIIPGYVTGIFRRHPHRVIVHRSLKKLQKLIRCYALFIRFKSFQPNPLFLELNNLNMPLISILVK